MTKYGRRDSVAPDGAVYWTLGSRTYPIDHITGLVVDLMVLRFIENANTGMSLRKSTLVSMNHLKKT